MRDRALENTMRLQPPVLIDFGANPLRVKHIPFMDDESIRLDAGGPMGLNLPTEQEINGTIAAFYPGVLDRLSQMARGDGQMKRNQLIAVILALPTVLSIKDAGAAKQNIVSLDGFLSVSAIYT